MALAERTHTLSLQTSVKRRSFRCKHSLLFTKKKAQKPKLLPQHYGRLYRRGHRQQTLMWAENHKEVSLNDGGHKLLKVFFVDALPWQLREVQASGSGSETWCVHVYVKRNMAEFQAWAPTRIIIQIKMCLFCFIFFLKEPHHMLSYVLRLYQCKRSHPLKGAANVANVFCFFFRPSWQGAVNTALWHECWEIQDFFQLLFCSSSPPPICSCSFTSSSDVKGDLKWLNGAFILGPLR